MGAWLSNWVPKLYTTPQPICWDAFIMQHSWYVKLTLFWEFVTVHWDETSCEFYLWRTPGMPILFIKSVVLYFSHFVNSAVTWTAAWKCRGQGAVSWSCLCLSSAVCLCCFLYNSPTVFKVQLLELLQTETGINSAQPFVLEIAEFEVVFQLLVLQRQNR